MRFRRYDKDAPYSYTFGVFPTLELLRYQTRQASEVLLSSEGESNDGVAKILALCKHARIPVTVNDKLIGRLSNRADTYAIGVFQKYHPRLDAESNHVALVNPGDMGNLGATLRTMVGFGFTNLALIRPAVDLFDPRVVRASMGALFQTVFAYFDTFTAYCAAFPRRMYPFMTDGVVALREARFEPPFTLVFGNESSGLPADFRETGTSVIIPHRLTIDSLNLPVAIGIALYEVAQASS